MTNLSEKQEYFSPPKKEKNFEIKDKLWLVLEVVWIIVLILPSILAASFRTIFPPRGKCLDGKVVLVTGSERGLGKGMALEFSRAGCKVAVAGFTKDLAERTAKEIINDGGVAKAYFFNVAKVQDVQKLRRMVTEDLGPVDILVNNAGLVFAALLVDMTDEEVSTVITVNLTSHFWMVREFLPAMRERNTGHIVAIASVAGLHGVFSGSAYSATKFGVRGFMECLRAELNARPNNNIKTTTVYPYFINTNPQYLQQWDHRYPPVSLEVAVKEIMEAVKTDQLNVTVPWFLYPLITSAKVLPQNIVDMLVRTFYFGITLTSREERRRSPTAVVGQDLSSDK